MKTEPGRGWVMQLQAKEGPGPSSSQGVSEAKLTQKETRKDLSLQPYRKCGPADTLVSDL